MKLSKQTRNDIGSNRRIRTNAQATMVRAAQFLHGLQGFIDDGKNLLTVVIEFISGLRRLRPSVPVDSAVAESLSHQPHQESRLVMREFMSAFGKLAPTQREALLLAVLEGQSYEVIAAHTGVSVGTVKSRISRARDTLERLLLEGETAPRPDANAERAPRSPATPPDGDAQDRR